ncbi:MAG TPA: HDIG domain-containing protein, partial [Dehalococcoidia bacterium]|nr:HDIG domain-containing protein [Dehalococcoidia bacterium]
QETLAFDPSIAAGQQSQLNALLGRIRTVLDDPASSAQSRATALDRIERLSLSPASKSYLASLPAGETNLLETESRRTLATIFEQTLPSNLVIETRERASTYVSPAISREMSTLISEVVRPFIVSNLVVDKTRTDAAREAARAGIAPVQVSFAKNQVIVERDTPVTPEAREALLQGNLISSGFDPELIGASALIAAVIAIAIVSGLAAFRPRASLRQVLAIGAAVAAPVFLMKLYLPQILPDEQRHFLAYIMPVAAASMVVSGFVGVEMAVLAATLIALLTSFAAVLLLDVTVVGIAGTLDILRIALFCGITGVAGVFAVRNAESLSQFLLGGLVVGLGGGAVLSATWLIDPNRALSDLAWIVAASASNGVLSAFLSAGVFVTLGSVFGITTRLQLLEMSQLSSPLLLRLQDEAPSTFQHSVIVANLAEKGALEIGADALLARVGCYYHDIGKLVRPGFFIENQLGGDNPHDALDPEDSARIIADHVNDGRELAKQYKLPARVAAFIPEHHGTRTVTYFYRRAAEENPDVDVEAFSYPGPKPQSRETAIAMLADSTEAAVRSSPDHSAESIDSIVEQVFTERLSEGQLDESDLTLRNVRSLAASFKATLRAVYHPRIEYPAPTEAEMLLRRLPYRGALRD